MTDNMVILYALRYAMGKDCMTMAVVSRYIMENLHDISYEELKEIKDELTDYYREHTDDSSYLLVTKLCVAIKRELYDE